LGAAIPVHLRRKKNLECGGKRKRDTAFSHSPQKAPSPVGCRRSKIFHSLSPFFFLDIAVYKGGGRLYIVALNYRSNETKRVKKEP
jgi:hypothetical protein